MINNEITYERSVTKSYMKIPAVKETCLDEKLILKRGYQGFVSMEKCYVDGVGQYWYDISGKQALDAFCRVNQIDQRFFETIILQICNQLEALEWNLIDANCMVVNPELIFINHSGEEVSFVLYPNAKGNILDELQELMEYLLTKLNHGDRVGVQQAYEIYNVTLQEGYSIEDLKQVILSSRKPLIYEQEEAIDIAEEPEDMTLESEDLYVEIERKLVGIWDRVKEILQRKEKEKEKTPMVVYPEEVEEEETQVINPTICLANNCGQAMGKLFSVGGDEPDFELAQGDDILGKSPKATLRVTRETISQLHAKFEYSDSKYYIEDLNSTNGTYVNEELLNYKEKRVLTPGDILCFADVKYRFL